MKISLQEQKNATRPGTQLARLGDNHGYRFEGDFVRLNAMFTVLNEAAHARQWSLQLWACSSIPASADRLAGLLVTEVALPPMGEVADDTENFETSGPAMLPAGTEDHVMVLALACKTAGQRDEVHDMSIYPQREKFCLPRLSGNVDFRVEENRVTINVERIENPRNAADLSGTLALELWALADAYRGGAFSGIPLAGVAIDPLSGQCEYRQRTFELPFTAPAPGTWSLVLMLREWTAAGFVTRDFRNFAIPMTVDAPTRASAPSAPIKTLAPQPAPRKKSTARAKQPAISVNLAKKKELATVKGLPKQAAAGIVAKRPFRSLDDLIKVKGIGPKLLAKLRSKLKL